MRPGAADGRRILGNLLEATRDFRRRAEKLAEKLAGKQIEKRVKE